MSSKSMAKNKYSTWKNTKCWTENTKPQMWVENKPEAVNAEFLL